MSIQVIDNILPDKKFNDLLSIVNQMSWDYDHYIIDGKDKFPHFYHTLFYDLKVISEYYDDIMDILIDDFPLYALHRLKFNLYPFTGIQRTFDFHVDAYDIPFKPYPLNVCIFSLNTNNGFTDVKMKNGEIKRFQSIKNRGIMFPNSYFHRGSNCTDKDERIVLNMVYA